MNCPKCNYNNADESALYCGLCYEPLKKAGKTETTGIPPDAAPAETQRSSAGLILQIALIAGLLSGAAVYFYGTTAPAGEKASAALEAVHLREKTAAAESLLTAYNRAREELLKEIDRTKIDPEGFGLQGQYTVKLFKLEEDFTNGLNDIQLPSPKSADGTKNASYIKWSEDFEAKEMAAMENFNKKYNQLIHRAGAR